MPTSFPAVVPRPKSTNKSHHATAASGRVGYGCGVFRRCHRCVCLAFVGENFLRRSAHCRPTSRSNASRYRVSDFSTMELIDHPATPRTASARSMSSGGSVSAMLRRCALGLVRGLGIGPVFTGCIPFAESPPSAVLRWDVSHVFVRVAAVEMRPKAPHSEVFATVGARSATTNKSHHATAASGRVG
jgi:hypothetical protein